MKQAFRFVSAAFLLAVIVWLLSGCTSPEQQRLAHELMQTWEDIIADGVITQEERQLLAQVAMEYKESVSSTDWGTLIATQVGTIIAAVLGTNMYRNRGLPGANRK
jgi:hypothetical protein